MNNINENTTAKEYMDALTNLIEELDDEFRPEAIERLMGVAEDIDFLNHCWELPPYDKQ